MKEIKTRSEEWHTDYVCEVCGRNSMFRSAIEACERQHGCKHDPVYDIDDGDRDSCDHSGFAISFCRKCEKELGRIRLDGFDSQEELKAIYELLSSLIAKREEK